MECLFIPGRTQVQKGGKGGKIADVVVSYNANVRGIPADELEAWVRHLYQRRNDAAHEGIDYPNEINVSRLEELTRAACQWAASHLDRHHRTGGACRTFADVHEGDHSD